MEIAKFLFKFNNQMLPDFFNNYFTKLGNIQITIPDKKLELNFFSILLLLNQGKNSSSYRYKGVEK